MLSNKQNLLDHLTYNLTPKDIERNLGRYLPAFQ